LIVVLILTSITYFTFIGQYPLLEPDEGRYAEIAREMLETGNFITPHLNYVKYFEKPPLFYWLTAMSLRVFGQNESAIRMVSSLTGFLTILLIIGLGKRLFNTRVGVIAGWIYLTSARPLAMARRPIIDGFFSLCLSTTWGSWWLGYKAATSRARQGWYLMAWACLGLATMTKGIAAIALTGFIIFLFLLLRRNWSILKQMAWWPGLLIFLIISLPWHVAAYLETPEFAHFYFVVQHFGRLVGNEHVKPFWFFLAVFPLIMMPWGTLLFPTAWDAIRRSMHAIRLPQSIYPDKRTRKSIGVTENDVRQNQKNEIFLFLVIWIVTVIGLFSISRSKLIPYILPACPAASLLLADYLENEGLSKVSTRWCMVITALLLFAIVPVISYAVRNDHTLPLSQMTFLTRILQVAFLVGGLLLILSVFRIRLIPGAVGCAFLLILLPITIGAISVVQYTKIGTLAKALPNPLPPRINIAEWKTYDRSLSFYSRRRIILIDEDSEISFGKSLDNNDRFFKEGIDSIVQLSKKGPLLLNLRPSDWSLINSLNILKVVAADNKNILVGNELFFYLTGLKPWPDNVLYPPPRLLMPQAAASDL
jgi:4-amino-4-deoxy-L-arabinose transferase-like glycosyltransferase